LKQSSKAQGLPSLGFFIGVSGMTRSVIGVCNRGAKAIRELTGRMKVPARTLMTGTSSRTARVSIARWNPKGLRRTTGSYSKGAIPPRNQSAQAGEWSSLHYGGEGVLIHPPHQGVCGRHGTEEQRVTSGELAESPGGTGVSRPISKSEVASDALSVVGLPNST
jgi:hypothetical protein